MLLPLPGAAQTDKVSPAAAAAAKPAAPGNAGFDLDMLRERGIDPQLAEYFKEAPRFRPGVTVITLFVNGAKRGRIDARFNDKGELCFDKNVLDKGGLRIPDRTMGSTSATAVPGSLPTPVCYDYKASYPQTAIELRPGKEEVALIVPTSGLRPNEGDFSGYSSGGKAAILNYDILAARSQFSSTSSDFLSANLELGFNLQDWIVRTREMYSAQDNTSQRQHLYAYAQRTLMDYKSILQGGQINIASSAFASGPVTGVQILPEAALTDTGRNNVMVEGIAQSQARVEVRQVGAMIYTAVVPPGPFALTDLPLLNATSDLEVTVIEANGAQRRFIVPAASLHSGTLGNQRGYSFALGKLRSLGNSTGRQPWLATATGGWPLTKQTNVSAGLMAATSYQAASWGFDTRLFDTNLSLQQRMSNAAREGERGTQILVSSSSILSSSLSLSLSGTQQTLGYRDLMDTTIDLQGQPDWAQTRYRGQYTASLGWARDWLGGVNVSYSRSVQFTSASTQRVIGAWGKTYDFGTVNFNLEHEMGGGTRNGVSANTFYLTLSIPLGKRSVRSYVNNSSGYNRLGASVNEQLNDYVNYTVSAERNTQSRETDLSTQVAVLPRYAQVNLGYSRYGSGSTAYNGGIRGGMVLHEQGLTLSPYPVQDTFGVLKVGDVSGIKVSTPYGPVWTDLWGQAVISQMPAYVSSRVEITTKSLPRNVDIKNGFKVVDPGRGSVNYVNFEVIRVRRILLNAKGPDQQVLPKGAFVLDADNQFVTTVVDDGQIFLINGIPGSQLHVQMPDGKNCSLQYKIADKPDPDMFFESTEAICRPDLQARKPGVSYVPSAPT
jgi:outer membrane usher protein FimD/PapC